MRSCAIWCSTTSNLESVCGKALPRDAGVASAQPHDLAKYAEAPALCRSLRVWQTPGRSAQTATRPPEYGAGHAPTPRLPCIPQRACTGLYHLEQHLARLEANRARAETLGSVRHGPSLLAGLLVCGRCHCRMQVRYGARQLHSYTCNRLATNYGGTIASISLEHRSMRSSVVGAHRANRPP